MADPQFDPSKPYSVIGPETGTGGGPTFDPSKPFEPITFGSDEYIKTMAQKHGVNEDTVRAITNSQGFAHTMQGVAGTVGLGSLIPKGSAATRAAMAPSDGSTFGERYRKQNALQQEIVQDYEREHPIRSTAAELGGAGLTGAGLVRAGAGGLIGAVGGGLGKQIPASMAAGGGYGALDAALRGEDVGSAAGIGTGLGLVGPIAGRSLEAAGGTVRNLWRGPAVPAVPGNTVHIAGVDFPLSGGQATGDIAAQRREQAGVHGALGTEAQGIGEGFFGRPNDPNMPGRQGIAREQVEENIARSFDPSGTMRATNPNEAGQAVTQAVRDAYDASVQNFQQGYRQFAQTPGDIHAPFFSDISQRIRDSLTNRAQPVVIDNVTTPVASKALSYLQNTIDKLVIPNQAMPGGQPNPSSIVGINLQGIDQIQKSLNSMRGATQTNPTDRRALDAIRHSLEDEVRSAIQQKLFTGQADQALAQLQAAKAAYSTHAKLFSPAPNDQGVGRMIQQIAGVNGFTGANPTEVANWIYNQTNIGGTPPAVRLVQRLIDILGPDHPAIVALKQGLLAKLVDNTSTSGRAGTQAIANRIDGFLRKGGLPMAQLLFSPTERAQLDQFRGLMQQITPLPGAVNYSGTAYALPLMARHVFANILGGLGAAIASPLGPVGHIAGYATAHHAGQALVQRGQASKLAQSIYQTPAQQRAEAQLAERWGRYGATVAQAIRAGVHPAAAIGGRRASDGEHYLPDPTRPGQYLRIDDRRGAAAQ